MGTKQMTYKDEAAYNEAMDEILNLMNKGEGNLTHEETERLRSMALAEAHEDTYYPFANANYNQTNGRA